MSLSIWYLLNKWQSSKIQWITFQLLAYSKSWSGILMAKWSYIMWCIIKYNIITRNICTPCTILVDDTPVLFEISSKTIKISWSDSSTFWKPSRMSFEASACWLVTEFATVFVVTSFVVVSLVVASFVVAKVEVTSKSLPANKMSPGDIIESSSL